MKTFFFRYFLVPDDGGSPTTGSSPSATPAPTPAPSSAPSSSPAVASSGGAGGGNSAPATPSVAQPGFNAAAAPSQPAAPTAPQPGAQQFQQPSAPSNPMAIVQQLPAHMQQLLMYGHQQWVKNQGQQQQQAGPAPTQQQKTNPFGIPSSDFFALRGHVTRDEQGNLIAKPGAPMDAAMQLQSYADAFEKAQHGFLQDPEKYIGSIIDQRAQKIAEKMISDRFEQTSAQYATKNIISENSNWLYENNNGQVAYDYNPLTGATTPKLSAAGRVYAEYAQQAHQMGITHPVKAHEYAFNMLKAAMIFQQQRNAGNPAAGNAAAQQFIQQAAASAPNPNQPPPNNTPAPPANQTLRDQLRAAFQQNGVNDKALEDQMRAPQGAASAA